jgi:hypothetical protein
VCNTSITARTSDAQGKVRINNGGGDKDPIAGGRRHVWIRNAHHELRKRGIQTAEKGAATIRSAINEGEEEAVEAKHAAQERYVMANDALRQFNPRLLELARETPTLPSIFSEPS